MQLPEKVKEAIKQVIERVQGNISSLYIEGLSEGLYEGAEIALSTPADVELAEEMETVMVESKLSFADHIGVVILTRHAGELCAAVAHHHIEALEADFKEVQEDHKRLVRELDVLLNGEEGAAKQASLCDIVAQVRKLNIKTPNI